MHRTAAQSRNRKQGIVFTRQARGGDPGLIFQCAWAATRRGWRRAPCDSVHCRPPGKPPFVATNVIGPPLAATADHSVELCARGRGSHGHCAGSGGIVKMFRHTTKPLYGRLHMKRSLPPGLLAVLCAFGCQSAVIAAGSATVFGPINVEAHGSGPGVIEWFDGPPPVSPTQAWTVSAWVRPTGAMADPTLVAGFGDGIDFIGSQRYLAADASGWFVWIGNRENLKMNSTKGPDRVAPPPGTAPVMLNQWQHLAATFDGATLSFYVNGKLAAGEKAALTEAAMQPLIAPPPAWKNGGCFAGKVAGFTIQDKALAAGKSPRRCRHPAQPSTPCPSERAPDGPTPVNRWTEFRVARATSGRKPRTASRKPVPAVTTTRTPKLSPRPTADAGTRRTVGSSTAAGNWPTPPRSRPSPCRDFPARLRHPRLVRRDRARHRAHQPGPTGGLSRSAARPQQSAHSRSGEKDLVVPR